MWAVFISGISESSILPRNEEAEVSESSFSTVKVVCSSDGVEIRNRIKDLFEQFLCFLLRYPQNFLGIFSYLNYMHLIFSK